VAVIHQIVGLLVFSTLTTLTIVLTIRRGLSTALASVLLTFTLISSLSIAGYDRIEKLEFALPGLKSIENEVQRVKETAISEILMESEGRRKSLADLVTQVNVSVESLQKERLALEALLAESQKLRQSWEQQQARMEELRQGGQDAKEQMLAIRNASADLALAMTKAIYLYTEAVPPPGQEAEKIARQQLLDGLDDIVTAAIPDPMMREAFVEDVKRALSPAQ
jgi:hypothetical protein